MFDRLTAFLDTVEQNFKVPAYDCMIGCRGKMIYRHSGGYSDQAKTKKVSEKDTYWLYSGTKLVTATAAMQLMERGLLDLEAPVARYLPEYKSLMVRQADGSLQPAEGVLTVRHLITMCGGMDYDFDRAAVKAACQSDMKLREFARLMAEEPLCFEPGTHFQYSFCHDILGAVLEEVSGHCLSEYVSQYIVQPLEMEDLTFHPSEEQIGRLSAQYSWQEETGKLKSLGKSNAYRFNESYESGGAGLLAAARDYFKLLQALACNGQAANGYRLLKEETVDKMKTPQLPPVPLRDFQSQDDRFLGYSYGMGVRTRISTENSLAPVSEFGWDGAAGTYLLIDTTRQLSVLYVQHVLDGMRFFQELHPQLRELVYQEISSHGSC